MFRRSCIRGYKLVFGTGNLCIHLIDMSILLVMHMFHRSGMEDHRQVDCRMDPCNDLNTGNNSGCCSILHFDIEGNRQVLNNQCRCIHHSRYIDWDLNNTHGDIVDCTVEFGMNCLHIQMDIYKDLELHKLHRSDSCKLVLNNHCQCIQSSIS